MFNQSNQPRLYIFYLYSRHNDFHFAPLRWDNEAPPIIIYLLSVNPNGIKRFASAIISFDIRTATISLLIAVA